MASSKPFRILHLTTHLNIGGITSVILGLGEKLVERGHEIWALSSGGALEAQLGAKGMKVVSLPIRAKSILHPKLYFALPKIIALVKKERFDLIHAHTRVTQVLGSLVSFFARVPMVTTAHGYYKPRFGRRLFGCWGKRVIAISPLVAQELEKSHRVPKSKLRVIFNGMDIEGYRKRVLEAEADAFRRQLGVGSETFLIGCISRLVRDKGHEVLIEAAAKLSKKHDIFLVMIGDGRQKKRILDLIQKHKLQKKAALLPARPQLEEVFAALDVFVHPATFKEGFGLTVLEAMAAKIPVVVSDIWAINSIIRNHVNGFLVPPKNAGELSKTLSWVIENQPQAAAIAQNAFEMASSAYSLQRMASEVETVYEEVLAS
jgi:glycosyltransferase involved in cell wall biosynthesis